MNISHFNCLRLNLCQESRKQKNLSCDFSQPIRIGSETERDVLLYEGPHSVGVWILTNSKLFSLVDEILDFFKINTFFGGLVIYLLRGFGVKQIEMGASD